jgi:RimJ/RimL family protein N-acetyltransferase
MPGPAYRIVTPRMVLRCWEPRDATLLCESIAASLDHLRATMLWAKNEPEPLENKVQRLREMRARFDLDQDYVMGAFDREERSVVGGTGLHPRVFEGGLEIGYWVDAPPASRPRDRDDIGAHPRRVRGARGEPRRGPRR